MSDDYVCKKRVHSRHLCASVCNAGAINYIRFRLGAWQIRVNDINMKSIARMERVCDHCRSLNNGAGTTECEDEYHVVFKCPLYADCRDKYTQLFVTDDLKKTETRKCWLIFSGIFARSEEARHCYARWFFFIPYFY